MPNQKLYKNLYKLINIGLTLTYIHGGLWLIGNFAAAFHDSALHNKYCSNSLIKNTTADLGASDEPQSKNLTEKINDRDRYCMLLLDDKYILSDTNRWGDFGHAERPWLTASLYSLAGALPILFFLFSKIYVQRRLNRSC